MNKLRMMCKLLFVITLLLALIPMRASAADLCYDWHGYRSCMPTVETYFEIPPPTTSGKAVPYDIGVMEATAQYRGFPLHPQVPYMGYVAAMTPAMIGWKIWIERKGAWEGPYLVVDCPRRNDQKALIDYVGEVVEVDFNTWVRWGLAKPDGEILKPYADVTVSYYPPSWGPSTVVPYKRWYDSIFISGPIHEILEEDIPYHPEAWCIISYSDKTLFPCIGKWKTFEQFLDTRRSNR